MSTQTDSQAVQHAIHCIKHLPKDTKFTDQMVVGDKDLQQAAVDYLKAYDGNFQFLLDIREKATAFGKISVPQARGILNCLRADVLSSKTPLTDGLPNDVHPGYYTVILNRSDPSDYVTLRVTEPRDGKYDKGLKIVSYLAGPDNSSDYVGFAFLKPAGVQVWKRFRDGTIERQIAALRSLAGATDPGEHGMAYALRSNNCCKCGRRLTVPASIHRGMGPVCAEGGWD